MDAHETAILTLEAASAVVDAALAAGRAHAMMPLTVAVLDAGGHLVAFKRETGSGILRPEVAIGKAWGALGMGIPTRLLRDRLADRPAFQNALAAASHGRLIPVPGGVLVHNAAGHVIGAVGISGDTSDKDEYCAIAGVKAAGLHPDPAEPAPAWMDSRL
ncbi:MAG: heme-binding protein [Rhodospirillales bacterium]